MTVAISRKNQNEFHCAARLRTHSLYRKALAFALFLIALPALTYMFLAAVWLLRVMRDYMQQTRF